MREIPLPSLTKKPSPFFKISVYAYLCLNDAYFWKTAIVIKSASKTKLHARVTQSASQCM